MIAEELMPESKDTIEENNSINDEEKSWINSLDPELAKIASNKGWKNYSEAIKSYQHLEKMFGAEKADRTVVLPKSEEDKEAFNSLYNKLGCPEKAADYNLAADFEENEIDLSFLNKMGEAMHNLGLNTKQAKSLAKAYQGQIKYFQDEINKQGQREINELKTKWGNDYERQVDNAKKAVVKFNFSNEELMAIENSFGSKVMLEKLALIGEALAEDVDINASGSGNFSLHGTNAKSKINELLTDPLFKERYLKGDREALKQITDLSYKAIR